MNCLEKLTSKLEYFSVYYCDVSNYYMAEM